MTTRFVAGMLVVIGTTAPGAAWAGPARGLHLGLAGGAHVVTDAWDPYRRADATVQTPSPGSSAYTALSLGMQLWWFVSAEATLGFIFFPSDDTSDHAVLRYALEARGHFLEGDWVPHLAVGVGANHTVGGRYSPSLDPDFHWGVGLRGMIGESLGLRVDLRHVVTDSSDRKADVANNLVFTLGFDFFVWRE